VCARSVTQQLLRPAQLVVRRLRQRDLKCEALRRERRDARAPGNRFNSVRTEFRFVRLNHDGHRLGIVTLREYEPGARRRDRLNQRRQVRLREALRQQPLELAFRFASGACGAFTPLANNTAALGRPRRKRRQGQSRVRFVSCRRSLPNRPAPVRLAPREWAHRVRQVRLFSQERVQSPRQNPPSAEGASAGDALYHLTVKRV